jgi:hypothetical protein
MEVQKVIDILKDIDVDGETMEYILNKVGMEEQMLRQLFLKSNSETINYLINEKNENITN